VRESADDLSSDTDTTMADERATVAGACYLVCKKKGPDYKEDAADFLAEWAGRRPSTPSFGRFGNAYG